MEENTKTFVVMSVTVIADLNKTNFKSDDPKPRAEAIVQAVTYYDDPQKLLEISMDLGEAMAGLDVASMPEEEKMASRGW